MDKPVPTGELAVPTGEVAWSEGLFFSQAPMERWNPDSLQWNQGSAIYSKMILDDQIRALLNLKGSLLTGRGWHFAVETGNKRQEKCAALFGYILEKQLEGTFRAALSHALTSLVYGYSLVEKVYAPVNWRGRTWWGLKALKLRPSETFRFETDVHGNLTGLLQEQGTKMRRLDAKKFIHHVNKPEVHPHYGQSDLRECHRHWWSKANILQLWNIYLERMAAGFVHGRITGSLSQKEREELKGVMRNLNTQTSVITPASVDLKMVTAPTTDAFQHAVAARDRAMAKALLVPNLLGFSEQGSTGSYSQSRTQMEAFLMVMNSLAESLADTLNEQLFRDLARWNFGLEDPPLFVFDPLTPEQKRDLVRAWREAIGSGAVTHNEADENQVRRLLDFPQKQPSA